MASISNITQVLNDIILEKEEDEGLAIEGIEENEQIDHFTDFNVKLCLIGRYMTEGPLD